MIILIVTFLSFVFEFVFNGLFYNSFFAPLVILTSLILVEPYFKRNKSKYYLYSFIVGFLYDLFYTGNYFMNSGIFLLVSVIVCFISSNMPNNLFVSMLEVILLIAFYRIFSYFIFFFNGMVNFSFMSIFKGIYSSLILNIIYGILLYFVLYYVSKKFKIKRIN